MKNELLQKLRKEKKKHVAQPRVYVTKKEGVLFTSFTYKQTNTFTVLNFTIWRVEKLGTLKPN